jgi:PAS domain S-box-containing protein
MLPANAFRFSPSLVAVLDAADGTIVDVNPTFEQLLGISRAEAIGKRTVELNVWPQLETRAAIWMRIRGEQRVRGDVVTMRTRDGRDVNGRLYAELFEDSGRSYVFASSRTSPKATARAARERTGGDRQLPRTVRRDRRRHPSQFPEGGFIDVNPALAQMFGFASPAEMLTAPLKNPRMVRRSGAARELFEQLDREGRV